MVGEFSSWETFIATGARKPGGAEVNGFGESLWDLDKLELAARGVVD